MKKELLLKDAYDKFCNVKRDSPDHYNIVRGMAKLFGIGEWKDKVYHWPQDIKVSDIDEALLDELIQARKEEGLKPASVNAEVRNLRRVYNYAVKKMRARPPEDVLKFSFLDTVEKTRFVSLKEEREILQFLSQYPGFRTKELTRDLYIFLVDTGVRVGECLGVRKKDIDLDDGTILVWREKTNSAGMPAMTPRVREVVMRRLQECKSPEDLLFQRTNRAIKYLRKILDFYCNKDPVQVERHGKVTIHTLRHTFASRLVMKEVSLFTVSTLLGHTSTQMSRRYSHLEARTKAKEAAAILGALEKSSSNEM